MTKTDKPRYICPACGPGNSDGGFTITVEYIGFGGMIVGDDGEFIDIDMYFDGTGEYNHYIDSEIVCNYCGEDGEVGAFATHPEKELKRAKVLE